MFVQSKSALQPNTEGCAVNCPWHLWDAENGLLSLDDSICTNRIIRIHSVPSTWKYMNHVPSFLCFKPDLWWFDSGCWLIKTVVCCIHCLLLTWRHQITRDAHPCSTLLAPKMKTSLSPGTVCLKVSCLPSCKLTVCHWKWPWKQWIYPLSMLIFHSYVSLPEGRSKSTPVLTSPNVKYYWRVLYSEISMSQGRYGSIICVRVCST